jgi:hypothetical protein
VTKTRFPTYCIVTKPSKHELEDDVREQIAIGYVPTGGLVIEYADGKPARYAQAMVLLVVNA